MDELEKIRTQREFLEAQLAKYTTIEQEREAVKDLRKKLLRAKHPHLAQLAANLNKLEKAVKEYSEKQKLSPEYIEKQRALMASQKLSQTVM